MNELNAILDKINDVYDETISNDEKHLKLSQLWTEYYKRSDALKIDADRAYSTYLIGESESFIIDQKPSQEKIADDMIAPTIAYVKEQLKQNKGISLHDAEFILQWVIQKARHYLSFLGISVENNSLNGFCELGQALTMMPLESMGLSVTKNKAIDSFAYPFNHAFGTVTFPIEDDKGITRQPFLVDVTYRQFFSTVRCNEGRYYAKEENTGLITAPDPGFFVKDAKFAKTLLEKGFIVLNDETAQKYGEPFYLSSLHRNQISEYKEPGINYLDSILGKSTDYSVSLKELYEYGFDVQPPSLNEKTR